MVVLYYRLSRYEYSKKNSDYHAYLLRIWSETQKGSRRTWRFVLLDAQTGKRYGFQSLNALLDFLTALTQTTDKGDKDIKSLTTELPTQDDSSSEKGE